VTPICANGWPSGRPLADGDLLLSRADGTWMPVREYSREFAAQRKAAGLKAITPGTRERQQHSTWSGGSCRCISVIRTPETNPLDFP
jgi:hypothetical protein